MQIKYSLWLCIGEKFHGTEARVSNKNFLATKCIEKIKYNFLPDNQSGYIDNYNYNDNYNCAACV